MSGERGMLGARSSLMHCLNLCAGACFSAGAGGQHGEHDAEPAVCQRGHLHPVQVSFPILLPEHTSPALLWCGPRLISCANGLFKAIALAQKWPTPAAFLRVDSVGPASDSSSCWAQVTWHCRVMGDLLAAGLWGACWHCRIMGDLLALQGYGGPVGTAGLWGICWHCRVMGGLLKSPEHCSGSGLRVCWLCRVVGDLMKSAGHRLGSVAELETYIRRPRNISGNVQVRNDLKLCRDCACHCGEMTSLVLLGSLMPV